MTIDGWIGLRVYIKTREGRNYSGEVIKEDDFSITILDKFQKHVFLNKEDLSVLQEESEND